jgi:hypothetical protein
MNFDDILFGLILLGAGLAGACFRSEYVLRRELRATELRKESLMRELHSKRLAQPIPSQPQLDAGLAANGGRGRLYEPGAVYGR